jgi:anion transporter
MVVYWISEPIDPGMTAIIGCFLFWILQITSSSVAFSGFTTTTPWYIFGSLLMGLAASRTGLAKRIGYLILHLVGTSHTRLLLGLITLVCGLNFLMPSANAQVATLAPILLGIVAALGLGPRSNLATGLFVILAYTASLFNKMFLGGGISIMTHGMVEELTGIQILWSQWFIAFLPVTILTIIASWLTILWLYPVDTQERPEYQKPLQDTVHTLGPWSREERKALLWLLLAITLWVTDFRHHLSPAAIGIGICLLLTLPKIGVLDMKTVKSVNFLLIVFVGGALSMGRVLMDTHALHVLTESLMQWMAPLLSDTFLASTALYWGGFLYHFLVGSQYTMASTMLPVLLNAADAQGYNPAAIGMLWTFAGTGRLFVYQASSLVLGYSFGVFTAKDLLKVGGILTLVEGLFVMILVPVYWPLIGLPWTTAPSEERVFPVHAEASLGVKSADNSVLEASQEKGHTPSLTLMQPAYLPRVSTPAPPASLGPDPETEVWAFVRDSANPLDFTDFLETYPTSRFAVAARIRWRQLRRQHHTPLPPVAPEEPSPPRQAVTQQWARPPATSPVTPLQIRYAQIGLRVAGFEPGPVDGMCGLRTAAALRQYQASRGVPVTGRLDTATQQALRIPSHEALLAWQRASRTTQTSLRLGEQSVERVLEVWPQPRQGAARPTAQAPATADAPEATVGPIF